MTQYWDWIEDVADATGYGGLYDSAMGILSSLGLGSQFVLLRLGDFSFCVTAAVHQELSRQTDYDWQSQRRLMRAPARQYVGEGDDAITLPGVIYCEYMGGVAQMDVVRAMGKQGQPYLLVDGMGYVLGEYCILSVSEKGTEFDQYGQPRKIEFSVNLGAYGDDFGGSNLEEVDVMSLLTGWA
jgi:phage protein U